MNTQHGRSFYTSRKVWCDRDGYTAVELLRSVDGATEAVTRVVFWDAAGQFYLDTPGATDVPVIIIEALIAEAKDTIPTG